MWSCSIRPMRARRRSTALRMAGVIVTCRPVSSRRIGEGVCLVLGFGRLAPGLRLTAYSLVKNFPLVRRWNLELLAVLGDCPARQLEAFALQNADDLRVA